MTWRKDRALHGNGHPTGPPPSDDHGATAVEYAILIALVGIVIVVAVGLLGGTLSSTFASAADSLQPDVAAAAAPQTCPPTGVDPPDEDKVMPTCDASTWEWTCPSGWDLEHEDSEYFCKKD